jgi:ABC-2 type transport system ATP-binding protein
MSSIISVKNLVKEFNGVRAVDGLSFDIEEGKITGLLGSNGAGKTTTIQMLLDIITPTSGDILIFGKDMKHNREEILSKTNFSSPYVALPNSLKVWENLYTFARLYGVKDIKGKIADLAKFFDIESLLPKKTASLSTGQLTRLNLTKALLNDPKLLLLDEPTASLDPDIADKMRQLLLKICREKGVSVLYTSHNMDEVEEICDRVIFISKGKITDDGTPADLIKKYGHKDLNDVFLTIARR